MSDKLKNTLKGKNGGLFPMALALGGLASGILYLKVQKDKRSEELEKKAAQEAEAAAKSKLPKISVENETKKA